MGGNNRKQATIENEWYQKPWAKITGAIASCLLIFGIGYSFSDYKNQIEHKIEIGNLKQEHYTKLQEQINACKEAKDNETRNMVADLKKVVEKIQEKEKGDGK